MSEIKIFVSCHKESYVPESEILCPIQVGTALADAEFPNWKHDNQGEHISDKNKSYCELTAQYWAWKNVAADYYGFFHYRRYLSFDQEYPVSRDGKLLGKRFLPYREVEDIKGDLSRFGITDETMKEVIEQYDMLTVLREPMNVTAYEQYCQFHRKRDMDCMIDLVCRMYPEYVGACRRYMASKEVYFGNIYVMKKELFFDYMDWLFPLLEEFERRTDFTDYSESEYRVTAYLAERLFGIYYTCLKDKGEKKCGELSYLIFQDTDCKPCVSKIYKEGIHLAFASNSKFAPYLAVMLQSIIEYSNEKKNYDIVILHTNIGQRYQKKIKNMQNNRGNFSIRFYNIGSLVKEIPFQVHHHITAETFYRYFIPDIFMDYDKVLYLDADMVVLEDIAKLYQTDVKGFLAAAVKDVDVIGRYKWEKRMKDYLEKQLLLKEPFTYFQAGVLVLNLEEMRKRGIYSKTLITKTLESKWEMLDQDVLNVICQGSVKYLNQKWNVLMNWNFAGHNRMEFARHVPFGLWKEYQEARERPAIIHYAGNWKPWDVPWCDYADEFWNFARRTSFYEIILYRHVKGRKQQNPEEESDSRRWFRLVPTKMEISVDMKKVNQLLPAGSRRRRVIRTLCGRFLF